MNWYFCFNEGAADWFSDMIKVAVISARANTTLTPHCIYDGRDIPLIGWLRKQGVTIHHSQVEFRSRLWSADIVERNRNNGFKPEEASGYYLPLEIANVERAEEFVLFTDCDVMFLRQVDLGSYMPMFLAAASEIADLSNATPAHLGNGFNSGVMIINVKALRNMMTHLINSAEENGYFDFPESGSTYDQGLLNTVFRNNWMPLPQIYNWRVYFGANDQASIVHWHGPKPIHVIDHLRGNSQNQNYTSPGVRDLMQNSLQSYIYHYGIFRDFLGSAFRLVN